MNLSITEYKLRALLYNAILPIFKSFDSLLQRNNAQRHGMHFEISELTRDLFTCILKDEFLPGQSGSKLKKT